MSALPHRQDTTIPLCQCHLLSSSSSSVPLLFSAALFPLPFQTDSPLFIPPHASLIWLPPPPLRDIQTTLPSSSSRRTRFFSPSSHPSRLVFPLTLLSVMTASWFTPEMLNVSPLSPSRMVYSSLAFSPRSASVAEIRPISAPGIASSETEKDHIPEETHDATC